MEARKDNIQGRFVLQTASITPARVKRRRKIAVRFDGVDMRSRRARRLKAILADLVAQFGDDANSDTIREIAVHRAALEAMQAEIIAGRPSASERAVRHSNCIVRLERELRAATRTKPASAPGQALADYLRQTYGAGAPGEADDGRLVAGDHEAAA